MDILTSGSETEFRLGVVARAMSASPDQLTPTGQPLALASRRLRLPAGPAITLREPAGFSDEEPERWDGLY